MKKVLRYLFGTQKSGIVLQPALAFPFTVLGYCDADWSGDATDRRSQTGFLIYLGDTLVAWSSQKQENVARSSTDSEYRAVVTTITNLYWVKNILSELGIVLLCPMILKSDNRGQYFS